MSESGLFITFEGGEGSGKSSQLLKLSEYLKDHGKAVVLTREPGGTPAAEALRHVLLCGHARELGPEAEAILFAAARADHVAKVIAPALADSKIVLSDRFFDSTRAYQGVKGQVSGQLLDDLETTACGSLRPDITFILDLDPEIALERANARRGIEEKPDRFEADAFKVHQERRDAFLNIAKQEPERCVIIDANGSVDEVFKRILETLDQRVPHLTEAQEA